MTDQATKILLIEDEFFIADLYRYHLEKAGFVVKIAPDGEEALNNLKSDHYDLILLDIMLPKINGLEVLKRCKAENLSGNAPIVLLTNLASDITIKEAFKLGASGYLIKASFTPIQLVSEIQNYIKGSPTQLLYTTNPETISP